MKNLIRWNSLRFLIALAVALNVGFTFGLSTSAMASGPVIVTPASPDWAFVNDNGTTGDWTAGFQNGPATPPLGSGSVHVTLSSAGAGILFGTQKYQGTRLADIQTLSYSTYTNLSPAAMAFQINYDPDVTTIEAGTWYGRLIYEPYLNGAVTNGSWQTWDTINSGAGKWWASPNANSPVDDTCTQASPCTWSTLIASWPNIGIRNDSLSFIQFKAGSNWNGFDGNVDNFSIEIGGNTDTYDFELPSEVYVNATWAGTTTGADPDGAGPATSFGADAFDTIQGGANGVATGGTVHVAAGTYVENVTIATPLTLAGADQATTIIEPAVSDPNCGDNSIGASLCSGASNIILVQADNVTIHHLTLDGDNPALTSGVSVGGADLDARNGIITNHNVGTYNGLVVHHATVKNIFLRGMYDSTGSFNFHDNTVTNVRASPYSIAMFAWYGPGTMANNTVSYANDAISANHSKGIQFLNNTIANSGSGVHTDNAGDGGGVADVIQGNTVSDCDVANGGYGIFVFVPYLAPTVKDNTVINCQYGLSAWGQGAAVTTSFTGNTVTGPGTGVAGSVGAYITTDMIGYGYSDVAVNFSGNVITNSETGVLLTADKPSWEPDPFIPKTINATFNCNQIDSNGNGADKGVNGTINNDLTYNWWGSATGPAAPDNPTGSGNSVAAGIQYSPWLSASVCSVTPPYTTSTSITSDAPDPSSPGQSVAIAFSVVNVFGSGPVPVGTVDVTDGASTICTAVALDGSGNGNCNFTFTSSGSHILTATFTPANSADFQSSTGTASHMVTTLHTTKSAGHYDGWILESKHSSGQGKTLNSTAPTFILGDDGANRQYRSILSFNTRLPAGAVITGITLKIRQSGAPEGSSPFNTLGNITVDVKKGTFGTIYLQPGDFNAPATQASALTIFNTPVHGWYSTTLGSAADSLINKAGTTQIRLRFTTPSNNNREADYLKFYSGNAALYNQPQLIIEYYVP